MSRDEIELAGVDDGAPAAARMAQRGSLRHAAVSGLTWTFIGRFGQQLIQFAIAILLARLLGPEASGLIALLLVFIAVSNVIADGGFGKSLIQKQASDDLDASSMFWFNVGAGGAIVGLLWLMAPAVAWFYGDERLTQLLRLLALTVTCSSFGVVHTVLLTKHLKFKKLLVGSWVGILAGGAVGIAMALSGWQEWSLVGNAVVGSGARTVMLWVVHQWWPVYGFSWTRLRSLLPYGLNLFLSNFIEIIFQHIHTLAIGRWYNVTEVGYYYRANSLQKLPVGNYLTSVSQVTFPLLAQIQNEPERVRMVLRKSVKFTSMVMVFGLATMCAAAEPLVGSLLGDEWQPAAGYLQLLCMAGMIVSLQATNVMAIQAVGRSDIMLKFQFFRKTVTLVALVLTLPYGIPAIILGHIAAYAVNFSVCGMISQHLFKYGTLGQLRDAAPYVGLSAIAAGIAWLAGRLVNWGPWAELAVVAGTGVGMYWAFCAVARFSIYLETMQMVRRQVMRSLRRTPRAA
jgi:O-antigen/teichoic acid export membrane protein